MLHGYHRQGVIVKRYLQVVEAEASRSWTGEPDAESKLRAPTLVLSNLIDAFDFFS